MAAKPLTTIQRSYLDFIQTYRDRNGYPPTISELCIRFGKQRSTVHWHLHALAAKGYLEIHGSARALRVVRDA